MKDRLPVGLLCHENVTHLYNPLPTAGVETDLPLLHTPQNPKTRRWQREALILTGTHRDQFSNDEMNVAPRQNLAWMPNHPHANGYDELQYLL